MTSHQVQINRAPVLTLWAAVVAERMGFEWSEALTLGKVLAGLNAQSKGRMLGLFGPPKGGPHGKPEKVGGCTSTAEVQCSPNACSVKTQLSP